MELAVPMRCMGTTATTTTPTKASASDWNSAAAGWRRAAFTSFLFISVTSFLPSALLINWQTDMCGADANNPVTLCTSCKYIFVSLRVRKVQNYYEHFLLIWNLPNLLPPHIQMLKRLLWITNTCLFIFSWFPKQFIILSIASDIPLLADHFFLPAFAAAWSKKLKPHYAHVSSPLCCSTW